MLNSALPCCRFMCTPHWQLFYLGVSTILGGQGSGPQPSNTSLCWPPLQWLPNVDHMPGCHSSGVMRMADRTAAPQQLNCTAVPSLKARSRSTSEVSSVKPTCDNLPALHHHCMACMLTLLVLP